MNPLVFKGQLCGLDRFQLFQLTTPIKIFSRSYSSKTGTICIQTVLTIDASSIGWISPIDEDDAPLTRAINGLRHVKFAN